MIPQSFRDIISNQENVGFYQTLALLLFVLFFVLLVIFVFSRSKKYYNEQQNAPLEDDIDFEDYYELLDLEIGKCYFAVAAYPEYRNKVFNRRKKIASKYTNVAKKYFASKQEDVEIIKLEGSVELGPVTGISDAIVDIVETGSTLKANGLEVIEKVSDISTRMIVNKVAFKFKKDEIMNIVNQLEKVIGGNQNA